MLWPGDAPTTGQGIMKARILEVRGGGGNRNREPAPDGGALRAHRGRDKDAEPFTNRRDPIPWPKTDIR